MKSIAQIMKEKPKNISYGQYVATLNEKPTKKEYPLLTGRHARQQEFADLYNLGLTDTEIGQKMHISAGAAAARRGLHSLPANPGGKMINRKIKPVLGWSPQRGKTRVFMDFMED